MVYLTEFLTIAVAHLVAVASPGPDFAIVLRRSISAGRRAGLWTSLGIALGILLHVAYCILGVAVVLSNSPRLFLAVKLIAAAYLAYLGIGAILDSLARHSANTETRAGESGNPRSWLISGFLTNGLNPKATLFFLALFTVVISAATPFVVQVIYGLYLAVATFAWFAAMSLLLGMGQVRATILRAGSWFERLMGVVLILLAVQLLFSLADQ